MWDMTNRLVLGKTLPVKIFKTFVFSIEDIDPVWAKSLIKYLFYKKLLDEGFTNDEMGKRRCPSEVQELLHQ